MSDRHELERALAWGTGGSALLVAIAVNLVALVVARIAGAEMLVSPSGGEAMEINGWLVFATTVVPLLIASVLLYLARRHRPRSWQVLAVVGLAVAVLTTAMPLSATATTGTKTALVLMHLLTGLVWFVLVMRAATDTSTARSDT